MKKFNTIILTSLLIYACGEKRVKDLDTNDNEKIIETTEKDNTADNDLINAEKKLLSFIDLQDTFRITNIKKSSAYPSSDNDTVQCIKWTLSERQIKNIIKDSRLMNGPDWHHLFGHYPCEISGQISQRNKTLDFHINSGSWLTVKLPDTIIFLGYFEKPYRHLFLDGPWTEENEK
jgi:hypothetical protein